MAASSKIEPERDHTPSSIESTPERIVDVADASQEPLPPQKRKGGRKPVSEDTDSWSTRDTDGAKIYATSEERKQRNRQAQAAFRERRTEYIKQLEATIKQNEETLASLQQSHRTAADECLMLRYKNSLLERILLEKGLPHVYLDLSGSMLITSRHRCASRASDQDWQPCTRTILRTPCRRRASIACTSSPTCYHPTATRSSLRARVPAKAACNSACTRDELPNILARRSPNTLIARLLADARLDQISLNNAARWDNPTNLCCPRSGTGTAIPSYLRSPLAGAA